MNRVENTLNWFGKGMNCLGNLLLIVMFVLILLVGADAIFQAYLDLHYTDSKIDQTLAEVKAHLQSLSAGGVPTQTLESEAFFARLESAGRQGLDSNTMSFVVQVLGLSLVSAGVYLLNRSHQTVKVAEKKARLIEKRVELINPYVADVHFTSVIMGYLLTVYHITWLLRTAKDDRNQSTLIAQVRDLITVQLKPQLQKAARENRGIESSNYALFMDRITDIKTNLESFEHRERVEDLISTCDECKRFLQESDFEENYQKQMKRLLDKPADAVE